MIMFLIAAVAAQAGERIVHVTGRDTVTIAGQAEAVSARCGGKAVSVRTVHRSRTTAGRLQVSIGGSAATLPQTFMNGWLTSYAPRTLALACDGTRLVVQAYVVRSGASGAEIWKQSATYELRRPTRPLISPLERIEQQHLPN